MSLAVLNGLTIDAILGNAFLNIPFKKYFIPYISANMLCVISPAIIDSLNVVNISSTSTTPFSSVYALSRIFLILLKTSSFNFPF